MILTSICEITRERKKARTTSNYFSSGRNFTQMEQKNLRSTSALFDKRRLTLARQYNELTKTELARRTGLSPAAIGQYESGKTQPGSDAIARLRWELKFPTSFFEKGRPSYPLDRSNAHFRSVTSSNKRKKDKLLAKAELLAELVHALDRHVSIPSVDMPSVVLEDESTESLEQAADGVREYWGLGQGPISNVVRLLEKKGCVIIDVDHEDSKVDAFSTVIAERPLIFLNYQKSHSVGRQRLNVAHELAHILLHPELEPGSRLIERQAYRFAAAFLMPREAILHELPTRVHWPTLLNLKTRWRCSLKALLKRTHDLGKISGDQYKRGLIKYNQNKWNDGEPGDEELGKFEQPLIISKSLELLERKRGIGKEELANTLKIDQELLQTLVPQTEDKLELAF